LFGSTSAPTAGSLFGSPAPAPFGQSNPVQQQQIPAQAALKAHLDATARQEQARVQEALEKIHKAYTGTALALADKSSQFVSIVYNPMTPELRQMQLATGIGVDGMPRPMEPPKPPQVSTHDWEVAVVSNPDYASFMPIALVGAEALQARLTHQQEKSNLLSKQIKSLQSSQEFLRRRFEEVQTQLNQTSQRSEQQQRKLLAVMRRVELARCYNQPLQGDEVKAMERLRGIWADLDRLRSLAGTMHNQVKTQTAARPPTVCGMPEERRLMQVLKEHRSTLAAVTGTVQKDMLDLHLIQKRIKQVGRVHPAGPPRG
jgi:exonuclease VII large subunit